MLRGLRALREEMLPVVFVGGTRERRMCVTTANLFFVMWQYARGERVFRSLVRMLESTNGRHTYNMCNIFTAVRLERRESQSERKSGATDSISKNVIKEKRAPSSKTA